MRGEAGDAHGYAGEEGPDHGRGGEVGDRHAVRGGGQPVGPGQAQQAGLLASLGQREIGIQRRKQAAGA